MSDDRQEFLRKLLATFDVEAAEHLDIIRSGLLKLEQADEAERAAILEQIYREVHSLKGAARAVTHAGVERLCHSLEGLFAAMKANRLPTTPSLFDAVHDALDVIPRIIATGLPSGSLDPRVHALIRMLDDASRTRGIARIEQPIETPPEETAAAPAISPPSSRGPGTPTIRIQTAKLDAIMRETEELLGPRNAAEQCAVELRETRGTVTAWSHDRAPVLDACRVLERSLASVPADDRRDLSRLLEHVHRESAFLESIDSVLAKLERNVRSDHHTLSGIIDTLLREVKEIQMLPFSSVLEGLRKLARDLSRDENKEIDLMVSGSDVAVDRRILEEMKAPLQHLLRNAIDHGIEDADKRRQQGKPERGTISITVSHRDHRVEIAMSDDGAGIDVGKVTAAAGKLGLVQSEQLATLGSDDALSLIFQSGLSTSPMITEISGRGLGLAIVREKVESLGGRLAVETQPGVGTTIRLDLPSTLATFRGVLVRAAGRHFMLPAAEVDRVARTSAGDFRTVENRETIVIDGRAASVVWLSDVLELTRSAAVDEGSAEVVVLGSGAEKIAFRIDAVVGEQEVLVRSLGTQLARVRNVTGAAILSTGEVVPVLNVPDLMRSAASVSVSRSAPAALAEAERRSILVVEDSITSRTLIRSVLEGAGYEVTTAVDGVDGYTILKTTAVDLIVSDVEMPRMDGFELTAKVRSDPALAHIPVVLVTALASREDRERGIDAGANAYIVKSSFEQSNLLEVVGRLI